MTTRTTTSSAAKSRRLACTALAALALYALATVAYATASQAGRNMDPPPNWRARYDDGSVEARRHVVMRPGWHVFAGPAALLWEEERFAAGNFSLNAEIFLFAEGDGESMSRSAGEPYGIVFGSADLDGPDARFVGFVIRDDRRFRIARYEDGAIAELVPWTESTAVAALAAGEVTVENILAVDATDERVAFFVNDEQVAEIPRTELDPDGVVGLRAGAGVSLHVTSLDIGPNRR